MKAGFRGSFLILFLKPFSLFAVLGLVCVLNLGCKSKTDGVSIQVTRSVFRVPEENILFPVCESEAKDQLRRFKNKEIPFPNGLAGMNRCGYINQYNDIVIPLQFQAAERFQGGLAAVQVQGLWGFINPLNELRVPAIYKSVLPFQEGKAAVQDVLTSLWGYIDQKGEVIVEPQYVEVRSFSEDFAAIKIGSQWGYIDNEGSVAIIPEYYAVEPFSEGWAAFLPCETCMWGLFNKKSQSFIPNVAKRIWPHSEGILHMNLFNITHVYYDSQMNIVFPYKTSGSLEPYAPWGGDCKEGLIRISLSDANWGYIDRQGIVRIPFEFIDAQDFSVGLAAIRDAEGSAYVNRLGKVVYRILDATRIGTFYPEGYAPLTIRYENPMNATQFLEETIYLRQDGKRVWSNWTGTLL